MVESTQLQELIEKEIEHYSAHLEQSCPPNLYLPIIYTLKLGGKRLRPLLVLLGYQMTGNNPESAMPAALAIEIFHNFTLLHDDIMDKAEIRRNQPAVHIRFNENSAILSGDVMAFLAYNLLLECKTDRITEIISIFTRTAKEICEGQQMDLDFEERTDVTTGEYLEMIRLKTAVLLGCALKIGGILGGYEEKTAQILYDAGICLGLSFQLQDDLLDVFGNEKSLGKKIGGDIVANKKTYLLINALQLAGAEQKLMLTSLMNQPDMDRETKVQTVKKIFEELQVREATEEKIREYILRGIELLNQVNADTERKSLLIRLFRNLISRSS